MGRAAPGRVRARVDPGETTSCLRKQLLTWSFCRHGHFAAEMRPLLSTWQSRRLRVALSIPEAKPPSRIPFRVPSRHRFHAADGSMQSRAPAENIRAGRKHPRRRAAGPPGRQAGMGTVESPGRHGRRQAGRPGWAPPGRHGCRRAAGPPVRPRCRPCLSSLAGGRMCAFLTCSLIFP